jgi:hypothetical protein
MGRSACTEPQCLYKGDLYLLLTLKRLKKAGKDVSIAMGDCGSKCEHNIVAPARVTQERKISTSVEERPESEADSWTPSKDRQ